MMENLNENYIPYDQLNNQPSWADLQMFMQEAAKLHANFGWINLACKNHLQQRRANTNGVFQLVGNILVETSTKFGKIMHQRRGIKCGVVNLV